MDFHMGKRVEYYSIKVTFTDLRSGEVLDWFEDIDQDKEYAEGEFIHLSNANKTYNYEEYGEC